MKVSIAAARRACEAVGARGVVLIGFDARGQFGCASYGETKQECAETRPTCDAIADALLAGTIPAPLFTVNDAKRSLLGLTP